MMTTDPFNNEIETFENNTRNAEDECESSTDSGSVISLSEKVVLESNEKRLRQRMTSLQTSIMNLKEQLKLEKELWKEDMEKIRILQQQQQEINKCVCVCQAKSKDDVKCENASRSSSNFTLNESGKNKSYNDFCRKYSIKQLLELQNYKRKLAETENMCNLELNRMKQSLDDLKTLQSITIEWGKYDEVKDNIKNEDSESVHEIFVYNKKDQ